MPTTETQRKFMCAVCGGRIKGRPGLKLPSKEVACEQCTASIKKTIRTELELEPPTKRFLVAFSSNLSSNLPTSIVQEAMRRARAHAGGAVKIQKRILSAAERKKLQSSQFAIPERKAYPIPDEVHARNALARVAQHGSEEDKRKVRAAVRRKYPNIVVASKSEEDVTIGVLLRKAADYHDSSKEERHVNTVCSSCILFAANGDRGDCTLVAGSVDFDGSCDLWHPISKSQPDVEDVHVESFLNNDGGDGICMFKSPEDAPEAEDGD